ncbi:hypothetical protein [Kibdelosporangium phytohabitans]|uniref:Uncharacterized protein n=1 Tax=Kibdelosporangium phytohabitans TaxID=860235 RepID=A0A0N9HZA7_9PSEU|nr:hypothetical protein [Kibdelosporangium phytohabitans]ALG10684.1 hypothetical protein AOZ06_30690 [Kibdelosporangium phytohabitans]MBE1461813.1 hypothetical protein [Kibdelosporangium phytohabitans]
MDKDEAHGDIRKFRAESKRYRNVTNIFQGVLIIGSVAATGASAIAADLGPVRWVAFAFR